MKTRLFSLFLLLTVMHAGFAADEIHWTVTGSTSVTFDWRGTSSTENIIRYGTASGSYPYTVTALTPNPLPFSSTYPPFSFWEATLNNLTENTLYHYAIGNGPDRTFRTPPLSGSSNFTVYVEGDIGDTTSYHNVEQVQGLIAQGAPNFVLVVGDLTYGNHYGQAVVDQHFNDVMVWSQDAAYMPAWGNHEWYDPSNDDLRNYKGRFDFPNPQTSPGSPAVSCCGEDWYWFDYGNVRFIAYPEPWSGAWSDWQIKAKSLMDQAQANTAIKFIVTFGHRPAYSSGHHSGNSTLKAILDGLGDGHSKYVLNLNGHSHNYERSYPQHGVIHITAGTGGASLEQDGFCLWLVCTQPTWSAFRAMHQGPVKLEFTETGVRGSFICGPAGGGTNDIQCTLGSTADQFVIGTPVTYLLTVSKTDTGSGIVTSSPAGINCGPDCSESYASATVVTLTATPDASSTFTGWVGACTGTKVCQVAMDSAKAVTATFTSTSRTTYPLTVSKDGTGSGTVISSPAGINCGTDCSEAYTNGTTVILTAKPATGSTFTAWSGACTGKARNCQVTMDSAKAVTATFLTKK